MINSRTITDAPSRARGDRTPPRRDLLHGSPSPCPRPSETDAFALFSSTPPVCCPIEGAPDVMPTMSPTLKALLLFALSIGSLSLANVLLKIGMDRWGALESAGNLSVRNTLGLWQLPLGVLLMTAQFIGMLTLFKWGWDASVVVPVFGVNYVLTAILGKFMLGEPVQGLRWLGIALVIAGVAFIARSVPSLGSS